MIEEATSGTLSGTLPDEVPARTVGDELALERDLIISSLVALVLCLPLAGLGFWVFYHLSGVMS